MRIATIAIMWLVIATAAVASELGPIQPAKPFHPVTSPPSDPTVLRQGGDAIADAVELDLLVIDETGTTVGYTDDYDEVCPYDGSTSPDVVYTFTPMVDIAVDIDMLGSTYDTKIYVYDESLTLVACNDDFYPDYVSKLENLPLIGGTRYYLVIDGYGGDAGDYVLNIAEYDPCVLTCPAGAELEGEPPLVEDYQDAFNGGCQFPEFGLNFSHITQPVFCGENGWYVINGIQRRDDDYYELTFPPSGTIELTADAEFATYIFELSTTDCATIAVAQSLLVGPCQPGSMVIEGEPGDIVWVYISGTTFDGPLGEYTYIIESNLGTVATESHSWSEVKDLYD